LTKHPNVLLVEDSYDDIVIMKYVLKKYQMFDDLSAVRDGEQAVDYIFKREQFASVQTPDIVLLDFNLPKKNGLEVLKEVRGHEDYSHLPIIILSTSSSPLDIFDSYNAHVNCFITKPVDVTSLYDTMMSVKKFWLNIAQLPSKK